MPRISALPSTASAQTTDEFPIVQGAVTKRLTFATAQSSGLFLPADNTVSTNKLVDKAITADKLQSDLSVNANRAVTSNHIQDSAVTTDKINTLGVTTPKLADGVITNIKLGDNSLSIAKFNLADRTAISNASSARVGGRVLTDGFVRNIVVYVGGSGYVPATPPAVTIAGPTTSGGLTATATAVVSGTAVTSIILTSSGSGYTADPIVTIAAPTSGTTARAVAYAIANGLATTTDSMARTSGTQHGSLIMTSDLKLKSFGYNGYGQLGVSQDNGVATLPQEVFLYTDSNNPPMPVKWYASGGTCWLVDEFGSVWSTGYGGYGQLGYGSYTGNSFVFQQIPQTYFSNKPIVKLAIHSGSSTNAHSVMALAADGSVYAWGYNGYGQLGIGNVTQQNSPILVPGTGTTYIISDVAIGSNVTSSTGICAMIVSNVNNQVLVAGYNGHGALANGTVTNQSSLGYWSSSAGVPVQNAKNLHISGDYPALAVSTTTGGLWTAGYNAHGQLGNNTRTSTGAGYAGLVIASGVNDVTGVGGYYGNFATRMNDGTIRVWGYNGYGQLGNGGTTDGLTPTNTFTQYAGRTVVKIACSQWDYQSTALLLSDGSIYCAGYEGYSRLGRQNGQSVASNPNWGKYRLTRGDVVDLRWQGYNQYAHLEVLTSDGKIYAAGYGGNGSLCRGDAVDRYGISNYLL